jgi:hypothetical protein
MSDIVHKNLDATQAAWMNVHDPEDPQRTSAVSTILAEDLAGDPFNVSWTARVKNPFAVEGPDGSWTFIREPIDAAEADLKLRILAHVFADLFTGNSKAHTTLEGGEYTRRDGRPTESTWNFANVRPGEPFLQVGDYERHLRGQGRSLLSIPIFDGGNGEFNCLWGCIDPDRHLPEDPAIDHAALARKVKELELPLVVCKSKGVKGAHLYLFLKDANGYACTAIRKLLEYYKRKLEITGPVDVFPKQEILTADQIGSGVNLPYYGSSRTAFGPDGMKLDLTGFLALACKLRSYGGALVLRDLTEIYGQPGASEEKGKDKPLPVMAIRVIHEKNLKTLRESNQVGHWNDSINKAAFWAARALAAGALEGTEKSIQDVIRKAAAPREGFNERQMESTLESGWSSGITQPIRVIDDEEAHDLALETVNKWLDGQLELTNDDALDALGLLTEEEYEIGDLRQKAATRLNIKKLTMMDTFVKKRRPKQTEKDELSGTVMSLLDVEPWDQPVVLSTLLDEILEVFKSYIIFQNEYDPIMLSLWVIVTFCSDLFNVAPLVGVSAMSKECGKTSLLRILLHLVRRGLGTISLTLAVAFRVVDQFHPTLIADEVDKWLKNNPDLLTIFLGGHEREFGKVQRCEQDSKGRQILMEYECFGCKCWGQINLPDDQLVSRSLVVTLLKKKTSEKVKTWPKVGMPGDVGDQFLRLQRQALRWAHDSAELIRTTQPDVATLDNRLQDNWFPLLMIATLASDKWKAAALKAAGIEGVIDEPGDEIVMLRDLRNIFHTRKIDRIPSRVLLADLLVQADSPWMRYEKQLDGLSQQQLGTKLRKMGVRSKPLRYGKQGELIDTKQKQLKGYDKAWFQNLFDRQLAGEKPEEVDVSSEVLPS